MTLPRLPAPSATLGRTPEETKRGMGRPPGPRGRHGFGPSGGPYGRAWPAAALGPTVNLERPLRSPTPPPT